MKINTNEELLLNGSTDGMCKFFRFHTFRRTDTDLFHVRFRHRCARNSRYFQFYFRHKYRRYFAMGTFLFIAFFLFMLVLEKISFRPSYEDDPIFDPLNNPNIKVGPS